MSELYEAIIFSSADTEPVELFRRHAGQLTARLVHLGGRVFGIYRVAGRSTPFDVGAIEGVAAAMSTSTGTSLAVFYDNSCGVRGSAMFQHGSRSATFGEADELWVPLDDAGEPRTDQPPIPTEALVDGEEYERVRDGIDLGLQVIGVSEQVTRATLVNAFCYERAPVLAES